MLNEKKEFLTTTEALNYLKQHDFSISRKALLELNDRRKGVMCKKSTQKKYFWYVAELDKLLP